MSQKDTDNLPRELELKFLCDDSGACAVLHSPLVQRWQVSPWQKTPVSTTYYDTAKGDFAALGLALRLREEEGKLIQSLKSKGSNNRFSLNRFETEIEISNPKHFPLYIETSFSAHIDAYIAAHRKSLRPYLRTDVLNHACVVQFGTAKIECAIDEGRVLTWRDGAPLCEAPLHEIEFELLSGEAQDFYRFVAAITQQIRLVPSLISKEQRGLRTQDVSAGQQVAIEVPVLSPETTVVEAWRAGMAHGLSLTIANLEPFLQGDKKAMKKLRQGLRRIQCVNRTYRRGVKISLPKDIISELKRVRRILGDARDWQVFASKTLARISSNDSLPPDQQGLLQQLRARAKRHHQQAVRQAEQAVQSRSFVTALIRLAGIIETPHKARKAGKKRAAVFTQQRLDKYHKSTVEAAARIEANNADSFHNVRLRLRRLRHVLQGVPIDETAQAQVAFHATLSQLQNEFGKFQDVSVARELMRAMAASSHCALASDAAKLALATQWLDGWFASRLVQEEKQLKQMLETFLAAPPFWR